MGYNQGLAVGLAVGLPSLFILFGMFCLWLRNRRLQRKEDNQELHIDVELRDNHLFTEFQEELHRPYEKNKTKPVADAAEKRVSSTDLNSLSPGSSSSHTFSDKRRNQVVTPAVSVLNAHQKTPSSYDFYETFIPILPSTPGPQDYDLLQPPGISTDAQSTHSSNNGSLIGPGLNRDLMSKSLDNLAKQLHNPQFFEKLPSRATTVNMKQRIHHVNNLSSEVVNVPERTGINDNYVYEVNDGLPRQKHPYHQRITPTMNLEGNFDNSIAKDAPFDEETPDVIFK